MAFSDFYDGVRFSAISADTAAFYVLGGRYLFQADATWGGGSVTLKGLMPDGTTYLTIISFTAANSTSLDLPPGTYKVVVATATAVQGSLIRVPYRAA
jgi:hypothetical protein